MDKYDKQFLVQEIKDFGFIKSENRVSFPRPFHLGLPKKVSIAWNIAVEKLFDNYIGYDLPDYIYPNEKFEGNFFKPYINQYNSPNLLNTFMKFSAEVSPLLETLDDPISQTNSGANKFDSAKFPMNANIGDWYDQIALGEAGASGNRMIGCYDSDGLPNNRYGASASFATETSYTFRAFTGGAFQIATAENWFAWSANSNNNVYYKVGVSGIGQWYNAGFGMPDPALTTTSMTTWYQGKVGLA
jgi:hypothetical protein